MKRAFILPGGTATEQLELAILAYIPLASARWVVGSFDYNKR
jgi:hypothetical protein